MNEAEGTKTGHAPVDADAPLGRAVDDGVFLSWTGRKNFRAAVPTPRVFVPVPEASDLTPEDPGNLLLEGDNRQAMVSLFAPNLRWRGLGPDGIEQMSGLRGLLLRRPADSEQPSEAVDRMLVEDRARGQEFADRLGAHQANAGEDLGGREYRSIAINRAEDGRQRRQIEAGRGQRLATASICHPRAVARSEQSRRPT